MEKDRTKPNLRALVGCARYIAELHPKSDLDAVDQVMSFMHMIARAETSHGALKDDSKKTIMECTVGRG
eukprot:6435582-Pyramimonas_sp.AAC.1